MATIRPITHRQMRAAEIWVRDGCKSKARALQEAGYGLSIVRHPERVFDSPAFRDELSKKGVNKYGMREKMSWEGEDETVLPVEITPQIDFTQMTLEQRQDLKEKLRTLETPRNEEKHSYVPTEEGVDILNGSLVQPRRPNDMSSFSAM